MIRCKNHADRPEATVKGESKLAYDFKPGEKPDLRFKGLVGQEIKGGECVLDAVPTGEGV